MPCIAGPHYFCFAERYNHPMGQGRHHGERAFEAFLRARRTPYVSVNEARRSLIPGDGPGGHDLKSFDFVAYTAATSAGGANLLVDIKCRRLPVPAAPKLKLVGADGLTRPTPPALATIRHRTPRLENWATREDIRSLRAWQNLFGPGFKAAFVFIYWSEAGGQAEPSNQPPDGLFDEVFLLETPLPRWYAVRGVLLDDYEPAMKDRSARWQTVDLSPHQFERLSGGFGRTWLGDGHRASPAAHAAAAAGR